MSTVQRRKRVSIIWQYFSDIDGEIARCNICEIKFSYKSSSTNLKKHLLRKHPSVKFPRSRNYGERFLREPSIEDDNKIPVHHESLESYVEKSTTPISISANYPLVEVHSEQQSINDAHQNLCNIRPNFGERGKFEHLPIYEGSNYFKSRKSRKDLNKKRQRKGKNLSEATKALHALVEQTKPEDECEIFGKSIASHLRNMSTKDSLICQKQILDFIIEHRLKNLEQTNSV